MYDTAVLTKEGAFLESVPSLLYGIKEHQTENQYFISGHTKGGQQVWVFEDNIKFKGSLCKLYLGDNIKSIGRRDTQRAIECLSDTLGVNFYDAEVTQLDVGLTIQTNYKSSAYYPLLGASGQYQRTIYKNSLYWKVEQRENIMYDKKKDAIAKGMSIPDFLINQNLSRFETKLKKKILNQLNRASLKASDLYQETFYMSMLDNWYSEYRNIKKITCMQIDKNTIKKPSDLADQILANLLQASGQDIQSGIDTLLTQAKAMNVFQGANPSRDYQRAKESLQKRLSAGAESELIKELDKKFSEHIKFYR